MFWYVAAISQVLVVGVLGALASWKLSTHEEARTAKVRPFPGRFERWYRSRREKPPQHEFGKERQRL